MPAALRVDTSRARRYRDAVVVAACTVGTRAAAEKLVAKGEDLHEAPFVAALVADPSLVDVANKAISSYTESHVGVKAPKITGFSKLGGDDFAVNWKWGKKEGVYPVNHKYETYTRLNSTTPRALDRRRIAKRGGVDKAVFGRMFPTRNSREKALEELLGGDRVGVGLGVLAVLVDRDTNETQVVAYDALHTFVFQGTHTLELVGGTLVCRALPVGPGPMTVYARDSELLQADHHRAALRWDELLGDNNFLATTTVRTVAEFEEIRRLMSGAQYEALAADRNLPTAATALLTASNSKRQHKEVYASRDTAAKRQGYRSYAAQRVARRTGQGLRRSDPQSTKIAERLREDGKSVSWAD